MTDSFVDVNNREMKIDIKTEIQDDAETKEIKSEMRDTHVDVNSFLYVEMKTDIKTEIKGDFEMKEIKSEMTDTNVHYNYKEASLAQNSEFESTRGIAEGDMFPMHQIWAGQSNLPDRADVAPEADEASIQSKGGKRSKQHKASCPAGCEEAFVVGATSFIQHLKEYHFIGSKKVITYLQGLHRTQPDLGDGVQSVQSGKQYLLCCSICYKECKTKEEGRTCAATHSEEEKLSLACVLGCLLKDGTPRIFKSKESKQKHMREIHHRASKTGDHFMTHTCTFCSKSYATKCNLTRHLKDSHKEEAIAAGFKFPESSGIHKNFLPKTPSPLTTPPISTPLTTELWEY